MNHDSFTSCFVWYKYKAIYCLTCHFILSSIIESLTVNVVIRLSQTAFRVMVLATNVIKNTKGKESYRDLGMNQDPSTNSIHSA